MNNIFKNKDIVELDSNYYLTTDNFKGICLVFHEPRTKNKKDGTTAKVEYEERFYYANIGQALEKYITLKQMSSIGEELTDILETNKEILNILKDFKDKYKNW